MKWLGLSLFILLLASCSRFSAPHYRKLKLVPAQGNSFSVNSIIDKEPILATPYHVNFVCVDSVKTDFDTLRFTSASTDAAFSGAVIHSDDVTETATELRVIDPVQSNQEQPVNMRRDWSVLIAIILLCAGVGLLLWSIAIFFTIPAVFWIRLLIGIGMMPLAIRMILLGTRILFNRWRNPVNYKESDR